MGRKYWEGCGWSDIDPGGSSWFEGNWRPDHTILRSRAYTGTGLILGDGHYGGQAKGHDGIVRTPSDHFAVRSQFTRVTSTAKTSATGGKGGYGGASPSAQTLRWSLGTRETPADNVPSSNVFAGTEAPTDAVEMLNEDASLWPNLLGHCYVWSSYRKKWYLMWPGEGKGPPETPAISSRTDWPEWDLKYTALTAPEAVNNCLVFKGTQAPTDAAKMLNSNRALWPNLCGECYVWSAYKNNWYRMWAR